MVVRRQGAPPNTVLVPKPIYHALTCADAWTLMSCVQIQQLNKSDASGEDEEGENDECDDDDDSENRYFDWLYQCDTFWLTC